MPKETSIKGVLGVRDVVVTEHEDTTLPATKKVLLYGWDSANLAKVRVCVDDQGRLCMDADIEANLEDVENLLGSVVSEDFGSVTAIPATEITIATLTAGANELRLKQVYGEGGTDGIFTVYVDGSKVWRARNAWTDRNVRGTLDNVVPATKTAELKVTNQKGTNHAFTGGLIAYEL